MDAFKYWLLIGSSGGFRAEAKRSKEDLFADVDVDNEGADPTGSSEGLEPQHPPHLERNPGQPVETVQEATSRSSAAPRAPATFCAKAPHEITATLAHSRAGARASNQVLERLERRASQPAEPVVAAPDRAALQGEPRAPPHIARG